MNSALTAVSPDTHHISDEQVTAFLGATNPCYINFPTDMREAVREYLERSIANGEVTPAQLIEFQRASHVNNLLGD